MVCSPLDATLVATGGGDDKGFMWKIGRGDFAQELSGVCMILQIVIHIFCFTFHFQNQKCASYVCSTFALAESMNYHRSSISLSFTNLFKENCCRSQGFRV